MEEREREIKNMMDGWEETIDGVNQDVLKGLKEKPNELPELKRMEPYIVDCGLDEVYGFLGDAITYSEAEEEWEILGHVFLRFPSFNIGSWEKFKEKISLLNDDVRICIFKGDRRASEWYDANEATDIVREHYLKDYTIKDGIIPLWQDKTVFGKVFKSLCSLSIENEKLKREHKPEYEKLIMQSKKVDRLIFLLDELIKSKFLTGKERNDNPGMVVRFLPALRFLNLMDYVGYYLGMIWKNFESKHDENEYCGEKLIKTICKRYKDGKKDKDDEDSEEEEIMLDDYEIENWFHEYILHEWNESLEYWAKLYGIFQSGLDKDVKPIPLTKSDMVGRIFGKAFLSLNDRKVKFQENREKYGDRFFAGFGNSTLDNMFMNSMSLLAKGMIEGVITESLYSDEKYTNYERSKLFERDSHFF